MMKVQSNIESLVPELNKKFSDAPAEDIVGYFLQAFKGRIALSSSLSIEDQTLTDIIVKTDFPGNIPAHRQDQHDVWHQPGGILPQL